MFIILHYVYYLQFKFTIIHIYIFVSQMSKQRVNVTYNTVEAIDFVLQSDDEDIGEVVDNNDFRDGSKYKEDKHDNVTLIQKTINKVKILIQSNKVIQLKSPKLRGQRRNLFLGLSNHLIRHWAKTIMTATVHQFQKRY